MYAVFVSANGENRIMDLLDPVTVSVKDLLGDCWEVSRPSRLRSPFVMIHQSKNDLPVNLVGSYLFASELLAEPVCGSLLVLSEDGQGELWGLDLLQVDWVLSQIDLIQEVVGSPLFQSRFMI